MSSGTRNQDKGEILLNEEDRKSEIAIVGDDSVSQNSEILDSGIESGLARRRFLSLMNLLRGKEAIFCMHERTEVKGIFKAINKDGSLFAVKSLKTPIGVQDSALIRTTDIVSISINMTD